MVTRAQRLFLLLAALTSFFFSMQFATNAAPMIETDEGPHTSYAAALASGTLPTIETPMVRTPGTLPGEFLQFRRAQDQAHDTIWVANHPPGFYLLAVPVVWVADWLGAPKSGLFLLRMMNAAFTATLVVLAGLLARELLPGKPSALFIAAAAQVAMSALTFDAGAVYNDGLGSALCAGALLLTIGCLRRGVRWRSVWWIAGLCAAAALTRSPGIVVTALCAAAVMLACWLHRDGAYRLRTTLLSGLTVAGIPALVAGWFYVRNWVLYGGPTASQYLVDRFGRRRRTELLEPGTVVNYFAGQWPKLFVQRRIGPAASSWNTVINVVGIIVLTGLVVALAHAGYRRFAAGRPPVPTEGRKNDVRSLVAAWSLVVAFMLATLVAIWQFLVAGANSHERYLLPLSPLIAVIAAAGLLGTLAFFRTRALLAQVVVGQVAVVFFLLWAVLIQFPTASWSANRKDIARFGGALGGDWLPVVFQVLGTMAALVAAAVAVMALWAMRSRTELTGAPAGPSVDVVRSDEPEVR